MGKTVEISRSLADKTCCFDCGKMGHYRDAKECPRFSLNRANQRYAKKLKNVQGQNGKMLAGTPKKTLGPKKLFAERAWKDVVQSAWHRPVKIAQQEVQVPGEIVGGIEALKKQVCKMQQELARLTGVVAKLTLQNKNNEAAQRKLIKEVERCPDRGSGGDENDELQDVVVMISTDADAEAEVEVEVDVDADIEADIDANADADVKTGAEAEVEEDDDVDNGIQSIPKDERKDIRRGGEVSSSGGRRSRASGTMYEVYLNLGPRLTRHCGGHPNLLVLVDTSELNGVLYTIVSNGLQLSYSQCRRMVLRIGGRVLMCWSTIIDNQNININSMTRLDADLE